MVDLSRETCLKVHNITPHFPPTKTPVIAQFSQPQLCSRFTRARRSRSIESAEPSEENLHYRVCEPCAYCQHHGG